MDPFCITCLNSDICLSCSDFKAVYGSKCVDPCPSGTYNNTGTCLNIPASSEIQSTAAQIFAAALTVGSFVLFGSSQSMTAGLLAKILQYIRYLDIDYSPELRNLLHQDSNLVALSLIPDLPEAIQKRIPSTEMPHMFEEYKLEAPFLANFWPNLFVISIAFVLFLILIVLQRTTKSHYKSKLAWVIRKLYLAAVNFLIVQVYCSFDEITLFFILQVKFVSFDSEFSYLSLILSIGFTVIGVVSIGFHLSIIRKYQKVTQKTSNKEQNVELFVKKYEALSILFHDFKDTTSIQQSYLLLFIIRNILANVILGVIYEYPLIQTTLFVAFSLLLIFYLVIKKPFLEKLDLLEQLFYEGIVLGANICVFIMSLKQDNGTLYDVRHPLGQGVIYLSLTFNIGAVIFLLVRIFALTYQSIKSCLSRKQTKKVGPTPLANNIGQMAPEKLLKKPINYQNSKTNYSSTFSQQNSHLNSLLDMSLPKDKVDARDYFLSNRNQRIKNTLKRIEDNSFTSRAGSLLSIDDGKFTSGFPESDSSFLVPNQQKLDNVSKISNPKIEYNKQKMKTELKSQKKRRKFSDEIEVDTINKLNNPQSLMLNFDNVQIKSRAKNESIHIENPVLTKRSSLEPKYIIPTRQKYETPDFEFYPNASPTRKPLINSTTRIKDNNFIGMQNEIEKNFHLEDLSQRFERIKPTLGSDHVKKQKEIDVNKRKLKRAQDLKQSKIDKIVYDEDFEDFS